MSPERGIPVFGGLKDLGSLASIMKNAGQIREQLGEVQEELRAHRISAETGGGAVRATVSGAMRVVSIEVDPTMMDALVEPGNEDDRQLASELIAGAVNAALEKAQQHVQDELANRARDMGLPIPPGMSMNDLLGGSSGGEGQA